MILNGDSSTSCQLFERRECSQRMLQTLLLTPAVHIHLGMALVGRAVQQLANGWKGLKCWVGTKQSEAKSQDVENRDSSGTCRRKDGPKWSLFWGLHLGTSSLQSIPHHTVPSKHQLSVTVLIYYKVKPPSSWLSCSSRTFTGWLLMPLLFCRYTQKKSR